MVLPEVIGVGVALHSYHFLDQHLVLICLRLVVAVPGIIVAGAFTVTMIFVTAL